MTASHLARMFIQFVIWTHGLPSSIVSDCSTQFTSNFWKALCQQLGIIVKLSTAHHLKTDGQTERQNQELERYFQSYVNYLQDDWVQWLPLAEFAANNTVSESSRMIPFFANKGYHPRLSLNPPQPNTNQEAQDLTQHMKNILKQLRANLLIFQEAQKSAANLHKTPAPSYQVGDQVWLNSKNIRTQRPSKKLDNKWIGFFIITELVGKRACWLGLPATFWIHSVFHVSLLRPTAQDPVPGQNNQRPGPVVGTDMNDPDIYEVDSIIDSQTSRGKQGFKYLVKWKG